MKTFIRKRKNLIKILSAFFAIASVGFCGSQFLTASANQSTPTEIIATLYQPNSPAEYFKLNSPIDACYFNDNYAVVHKETDTVGANSQLLYYHAQNQTFYTLSLNNIKQVNKLSNDKMLVLYESGTAKLKYVDINTGVGQDLKFEDDFIGGNYFDISNDYLVTAFNENITLSVKYGENILEQHANFITQTAQDTMVKLNGNGDVFYQNSDNHLQKVTIVKNGNTYSHTAPLKITENSISTFAVNDRYLYYFSQNAGKYDLYRVDLMENVQEGAMPTSVKIALPQSDFDLGKIETPSSICFKGDNLLITDSKTQAVEEFAVVENDYSLNLEYTGFAIAKGKTAFNRLSSSILEIERNGNTIAVLDDERLTVITESNGDKEFKNYLFNLNGQPVSNNSYAINDVAISESFTLGDKTAIIYGNVSGDNKIYSIDLVTGAKTNLDSIVDCNIKDVCFQSGNFYFMTKDTVEDVRFYKMPEGQTQRTQIDGIKLNSPTVTNFTVDVYGNLYVLDGEVIKSFTKTQEGYLQAPVASAIGAKKMITDLNGALYVLFPQNKIVRYFNGQSTQYQVVVQGLNQSTDAINDFAMDFINKDVIFTFDNQEYTFTTQALQNAAILGMDIAQINVTTGTSADITNLAFYSVNQGQNAYSLSFNGQSTSYLGLEDIDANLVLVKVGNIDCGGETYILLAGKKQIGTQIMGTPTTKDLTILVNDKCATQKTDLVNDTVNQSAYVATDVNMYYLPLITRDDTYCLTDSEQVVRLNKKSLFAVSKIFTFCDQEFYFALATINDQQITGYIPVDFTVEVLFEKDIFEPFTLEKVNATSVYKDAALSEELQTLDDKTQVRVFSTNDGVCLIAFELENGTLVKGYVKADAIKTYPNTVIRNMIIVMCVLVCVAGSSIFFIIKKKSK